MQLQLLIHGVPQPLYIHWLLQLCRGITVRPARYDSCQALLLLSREVEQHVSCSSSIGSRWLPPQQCTAACRLIVLTLCFGSSHSHRQVPPRLRHERPLAGKGGIVGEKCPVILPTMATSMPFRDLLHAANLWHGTDGFTSPPKEGMMRIFSPWKIWRFEPANLGTKGQHATSRPPKPLSSRFCLAPLFTAS
jgi:hypothetical protein